MTVLRELAAFAADTDTIPDDMARSVRFSLFDWAAVGIAGVGEPVARAARALAEGEGPGPATLFGGTTAQPRAAALINGATSHALDYDDTHFLHVGHPSVAVIPAALAVAQQRGADGRDLATALAIGLEVTCRIGDWLGRAHYNAGFHQTGTAGAFGAATAAGRLLGLDAAAMEAALALTATRASGLKSQFGTMGKPLNAGFAAETGVTCAQLAAAGATSNDTAIEGAQGFGATHAGEARGTALDGLGQTWVFPGVSYKFHACCHGLHAMLEALGRLRGNIDPDRIEAVEITTNPRWLLVCDKPAPVTGLEAKFSYRLTAAMALRGVDTAALDVFSPQTCARPDLVALRDLVTVTGADGVGDTATHVRIRADGRMHEVEVDILAPVAPKVTQTRLRTKAAALLGTADADALWQAVRDLETTGPMALAACMGTRGRCLDSASLTGAAPDEPSSYSDHPQLVLAELHDRRVRRV